MKISLEWLGEFVTWVEKDPQAIADRLTLSTAEVEEVADQGELMKHCCVGKIVALGKHPNADKLSLVTVKTDRGDVKVVCGGSNLRDGMLVAFAHVGATVKHGDEKMTLATVKIRGEESNGMICAAEELGLELSEPLTALGQVKQRGGKLVTAFAVELDLDPRSIRSNSFEMEWPPRSGKRQVFPEVDRAEWFTLEEAREKINAGQRPLLDRLAQLAGGE